MAYRDLVEDLHEQLAARGWHDVRPAYGFVLLAARDGPTTAGALAQLMGVTKQAASKVVEAMAAGGYVQREAAAGGDARRRPVGLTDRGRSLLATVESIYGDLEAGWAAVLGEAELERLRAGLVAVLRHRHGGALPPVRPSW
jgi:DNA-binding MarR family transcriptional regulator